MFHTNRGTKALTGAAQKGVDLRQCASVAPVFKKDWRNPSLDGLFIGLDALQNGLTSQNLRPNLSLFSVFDRPLLLSASKP